MGRFTRFAAISTIAASCLAGGAASVGMAAPAPTTAPSATASTLAMDPTPLGCSFTRNPALQLCNIGGGKFYVYSKDRARGKLKIYRARGGGAQVVMNLPAKPSVYINYTITPITTNYMRVTPGHYVPRGVRSSVRAVGYFRQITVPGYGTIIGNATDRPIPTITVR